MWPTRIALFSYMLNAGLCLASSGTDLKCNTTELLCLEDKLESEGIRATRFCAQLTTAIQPAATDWPPLLGLCGTNMPNYAASVTTACSCFHPKPTVASSFDTQFIKGNNVPAPPIDHAWITYDYPYLPHDISLSFPNIITSSSPDLDIPMLLQRCIDFDPHWDIHALADDGLHINCLSYHYRDPSKFIKPSTPHHATIVNAWAAVRTAESKTERDYQFGDVA